MNQMTPIAAGIASLGRGNDSALVHMTPGEVQGLQALAMAHGGSLTINPQTGLPEAGFLENLLPTIIGAGLMMIPGMQGVGAGWIGAGVGAAEALRTGDLSKGLMAGLQAFGGAGLGGALSASGAFGGAGTAGASALDAATGITPPPAGSMSGIGLQASPNMASALGAGAGTGAGTGAGIGLQASPNMASALGQKAPTFMEALGQQFPTTASKIAAGIGGIGALGGFEQPQLPTPEEQKSNYRAQGPVRRPYDPTAPGGYYYTDRGILQPNFLAAKGGEVPSVPQLEDGGFVLTKKAVDGIGGGSNKRGQRRAAAGLGAIPIRGPGTGTSDSIRTSIDGVRPAAVSNGEAYIPRNQVKRRGGAKKFYALMKQAERAAGKRRS